MYVNRDVEKILLDAAESFQVITIYGSRQVGKSTTVDYLFGKKFELVTLDDSEELNMAISSPRSFFESHPWPLIIDEVQKEPGLLSEIKRIVDEQRRVWMKNGEKRRLMFVLTGSNQFELQEGISESLAGRTAVINMSGFTQMEKRGIAGSLFEVDFDALINKLRESSQAPGNISFAVGKWYCSSGLDVRDAMRKADEDMYRNKQEYYQKFPERKAR